MSSVELIRGLPPDGQKSKSEYDMCLPIAKAHMITSAIKFPPKNERVAYIDSLAEIFGNGVTSRLVREGKLVMRMLIFKVYHPIEWVVTCQLPARQIPPLK